MDNLDGIKVGDKVWIVDHRTKDKRGVFNWNPAGDMDKWFSCVMTVRGIYHGGMPYLTMEEDRHDFCGDGWHWFPEMIECVLPDESFEGNSVEDLMELMMHGEDI